MASLDMTAHLYTQLINCSYAWFSCIHAPTAQEQIKTNIQTYMLSTFQT